MPQHFGVVLDRWIHYIKVVLQVQLLLHLRGPCRAYNNFMLQSNQTMLATYTILRTPRILPTVVECSPLLSYRSPRANLALRVIPVTSSTAVRRTSGFPVDSQGLRAVIVGRTERFFIHNSTGVVAALASEQGDRCRCTMAPETCTTK